MPGGPTTRARCAPGRVRPPSVRWGHLAGLAAGRPSGSADEPDASPALPPSSNRGGKSRFRSVAVAFGFPLWPNQGTPLVITGITGQPLNPPASPPRDRLSVDVSPSVALLLDHVSTITGTPKAQILSQALLDALPGLLERADLLKKRSGELSQALKGVKR